MEMMERLKGWLASADEARKQHMAFLASPEADAHFELIWLRSSRLVAMLGEIAKRTARADGWAFLSAAANLILREAPDELVDLQERFGLKSLKAVLQATGLFDVAEEALPNGGVRTIYRCS